MKNKFFIFLTLIFLGTIVYLVVSNKDYKNDFSSNNNESYSIDKSNMPEKIFYTEKIFSTLTPKTNSWMSSAFFKKDSEPLFVYPYSLDFTEKGFTLNIPNITSTNNTIFGSHNPEIEISFGENLETHVIDYGDIDATFELRDNSQKNIAQIRTIRGVPYIYIKVIEGNKISIKANSIKKDDDIFQINNLFRVYNIDNIISEDSGNLSFTPNKDQNIIFGAIPTNKKHSYIDKYSDTVISDISVETSLSDSEVKTKYIFDTVDNKEILFGQLNDAEPINENIIPAEISYKSIKGNLINYIGKEFEFKDKLFDPITKLDPTKYNDDQKNLIKAALLDDLATTNFKDDTYYGGKTMARQAYLYEIARDFGWTDIYPSIMNPLKKELTSWLSDNGSRGFFYEPNIKTLVGVPSSFGSELANDHHFHYGYIIYASSVMAEYDQDFLNTYKDKISLILDDYGSLKRDSETFPYLRVFDHYELHSWASGFALFQDGNNQESTSEAINSWYAMYRWALLTKDTEKQNMAKWLYSQEINSTLSFWLDIENIKEDTLYEAPIAALVWGGKIDYATWFSATDEAKLAIQLLPLNFATEYLKEYPSMIEKNIDYIKSRSSSGEYTEFNDLLLTYESTINSDVISKIQNINSSNFDDGNSKTASLVWALQFK